MSVSAARWERRFAEGAELSQLIGEMSAEADHRISAVFSSAEHDETVEALRRVVETEAAGADALEMVQTFVATSVMSKWVALRSELIDLRDRAPCRDATQATRTEQAA